MGIPRVESASEVRADVGIGQPPRPETLVLRLQALSPRRPQGRRMHRTATVASATPGVGHHALLCEQRLDADPVPVDRQPVRAAGQRARGGHGRFRAQVRLHSGDQVALLGLRSRVAPEGRGHQSDDRLDGPEDGFRVLLYIVVCKSPEMHIEPEEKIRSREVR